MANLMKLKLSFHNSDRVTFQTRYASEWKTIFSTQEFAILKSGKSVKHVNWVAVLAN